MSVAERRAMIDRAHPKLSVARQCALVSLGRSSFYYARVETSGEDLALMRVIDEAFLEMPWYGSRQMTRHLRRAGHAVGRKRVRRLTRVMGLAAIYQRPRTSDPHPEHRVFSVPAAWDEDRPPRPGLVLRHRIHHHAPRLPLPRRDHGLGGAQGARVARIEHDGRGFLRRGVE